MKINDVSTKKYLALSVLAFVVFCVAVDGNTQQEQGDRKNVHEGIDTTYTGHTDENGVEWVPLCRPEEDPNSAACLIVKYGRIPTEDDEKEFFDALATRKQAELEAKAKEDLKKKHKNSK